jgi:hypothetical protein
MRRARSDRIETSGAQTANGWQSPAARCGASAQAATFFGDDHAPEKATTAALAGGPEKNRPPKTHDLLFYVLQRGPKTKRKVKERYVAPCQPKARRRGAFAPAIKKTQRAPREKETKKGVAPNSCKISDRLGGGRGGRQCAPTESPAPKAHPLKGASCLEVDLVLAVAVVERACAPGFERRPRPIRRPRQSPTCPSMSSRLSAQPRSPLALVVRVQRAGQRKKSDHPDRASHVFR